MFSTLKCFRILRPETALLILGRAQLQLNPGNLRSGDTYLQANHKKCMDIQIDMSNIGVTDIYWNNGLKFLQ